MKPELEALLKAYDAFKQTPEGTEATRLFAIYEAKLQEASGNSGLSRDILHNAVTKIPSPLGASVCAASDPARTRFWISPSSVAG
jgi:hypothetical protein